MTSPQPEPAYETGETMTNDLTADLLEEAELRMFPAHQEPDELTRARFRSVIELIVAAERAELTRLKVELHDVKQDRDQIASERDQAERVAEELRQRLKTAVAAERERIAREARAHQRQQILADLERRIASKHLDGTAREWLRYARSAVRVATERVERDAAIARGGQEEA